MRLAILFSLVFISSTFAGCLDFSDDKVSIWPDKTNADCNLTTAYEFVCDTYLENSETPIVSLTYNFSKEIWIAYLDGKIVGWDGETLREVGNLRSTVSRCHYEQGLLGMEFDEDYQNTGRVLLVYNENNTCETARNSNVVLSHAKVVDGEIDTESLEVLIRVNKSNRNHNGGNILSIGNNMYIWSVGDGGGSFDPHDNGQNASTILGTIQVVHYENETIVPVNGSNEPSFTLHHGLRNPWRIDVDSNDNLWIADVGQLCYEEVNVVPLMQSSNFGWSEREGFHDVDFEEGCYENRSEPNPKFTDPIIEYSHENIHCSIIGGYWMDWGPENLRDGYLYGDFCSGQVWIAKNIDGNWTAVEVGNVGTMIVGFGKGIDGELLIFSWAGAIYQLNEI